MCFIILPHQSEFLSGSHLLFTRSTSGLDVQAEKISRQRNFSAGKKCSHSCLQNESGCEWM